MATFMQKLEYCTSTKVRVKKCLQRDRGLGKTQNQPMFVCFKFTSLPDTAERMYMWAILKSWCVQ